MFLDLAIVNRQLLYSHGVVWLDRAIEAFLGSKGGSVDCTYFLLVSFSAKEESVLEVEPGRGAIVDTASLFTFPGFGHDRFKELINGTERCWRTKRISTLNCC